MNSELRCRAARPEEGAGRVLKRGPRACVLVWCDDSNAELALMHDDDVSRCQIIEILRCACRLRVPTFSHAGARPPYYLK